MEVPVNIDIEQFVAIIRNLPEEQLLQIQNAVNTTIENRYHGAKDEYLKMLQNAPQMSDEQYYDFLENRNKMIQWRTK